MSETWTQNLSPEKLNHLIGGRRRYNSLRQFLAAERRRRVVELMQRFGLKRGVVTAIARELHVSKASISRDIATLLRDGAIAAAARESVHV
jgi:predicted DNA-binding transcriptional regulator YafY